MLEHRCCQDSLIPTRISGLSWFHPQPSREPLIWVRLGGGSSNSPHQPDGDESSRARGKGLAFSLPSQGAIAVIYLLSHVLLFMTPWTAACQASLSFTIFQSLIKLMSIELVMSSYHLILYHPLLLLPLIFSSIRVFSNEGGSSIFCDPQHHAQCFSHCRCLKHLCVLEESPHFYHVNTEP